jgi:exosortase
VPWLIALVVSLVWLYGSTLANLVREWSTNSDASYGLALAAVAIALLWRRRAAFLSAPASGLAGFLGLVVLAGGLVMYLAGQLAADVFTTRASLVVVAAGATLFCSGARALRALAAPYLFLLIAIPLPVLVVNSVTLPLQLVASRIAESSLTALAVPVFREGNLLILPSSTLEVAEACSGLRSLISLGAIAVMLAWMLKRGAPARVVLVASTVPIAVLMNGFRIAATGVAVEQWGPELGKGAWHELTGWVTFVVSLALLVAIQRLLSKATARHHGASGTAAEQHEGLAPA